MAKALVIGVVHTSGGERTLERVSFDVRQISTLLKETLHIPGDLNLVDLIDPIRDEVSEGLEWFSNSSNELLILYFSGHADQTISGTNSTAILCSDSQLSRPTSLLGGSVIGQILNKARNCTLLCVLDCCFSEDLASDIRAELEWQFQGMTFILSCIKSLQTVQPEEIATHVDNLATSELSLFTRNIYLGLSGIGQNPFSTTVDFTRMAELAYFEASRLKGASCAIIQHGINGRRAIYKDQPWDPLNNQSFRSNPISQSASQYTAKAIVGSDGIHAVTHAASFLDHGSSGALLGSGHIPLAISRRFNSSNNCFVIESLLHNDILDTFLDRTNNSVIVQCESIDSLGKNKHGFDLHELPKVELDEIFRLANNMWFTIDDRQIESLNIIREYSGDSLETSLLSLSACKEVLHEISQADADVVTKSFVKSMLRSETIRTTCALLASAPSVYLPEEFVYKYISHILNIPTQSVASELAFIKSAGIVVPTNVGLRMPNRIKELCEKERFEDGDLLYKNFLAIGLNELDSSARLRIISALCASIEKENQSGGIDPNYVDLLAEFGKDILYWGGARGTEQLLDRVLGLTDFSKRSALWMHLGDAQRLRDNYAGAFESFTLAHSYAIDDYVKAEAQVGIASAHKNSQTHKSQIYESINQLKLSKSDVKVSNHSAARRLFELGNITFGTSNWKEALALYNEAESFLKVENVGDCSLLIDIWKGMGDIHLHEGDLKKTNALVSSSLDLAAKRSIPAIDLRLHAKICQLVGDLLRHQCCFNPSDIETKWLNAAEWWYQKSIELYSSKELENGVLISEFKLAQCLIISGKWNEAASKFIHLRESFSKFGSNIWIFKSDVMICAVGKLRKGIPTRWETEARTSIETKSRAGEHSAYQIIWAKLVTDDYTDLEDICDELVRIGAIKMASSLAQIGYESWIGSEY